MKNFIILVIYLLIIIISIIIYRNLFKKIFSDIFKLYKNFGHWFLSKIVIFIFSLLVAFIIWSIFFIFYNFLNTDLTFSKILSSFFQSLDISSLISSIIYVFWLVWYAFWLIFVWDFSSILYLLWWLSFLLFYFFSEILFINLNKKYLENKRLSVKKNKYFDYKLFLRYLSLNFYFFIFIIICFILFFILLKIFVFAFWWTTNAWLLIQKWAWNLVSISSFVLFIIYFLIFIYFLYRFIFSYIFILENSVWKSIKKSFKKTKWFKKVLKFLAVILVFFTIYLPFLFLGKSLEQNRYEVNFYALYTFYAEKNKVEMNAEQKQMMQVLDKKFAWKTKDDLKAMNEKINFYIIFYSLFNFLFLTWVFSMIFVSSYKRIILEEK